MKIGQDVWFLSPKWSYGYGDTYCSGQNVCCGMIVSLDSETVIVEAEIEINDRGKDGCFKWKRRLVAKPISDVYETKEAAEAALKESR